MRRHNLGRIVSLVHRERSLSRAELTRATGLNRSTVSALVAELVALRLLREDEPTGARGVGRPSPVVSGADAATAIAVHPEMDAVTVGIVRLGGEVTERIRHEVDRPPTVGEAVEIAARCVEQLRATLPDGRVAGIGVAVPGLVRAADGIVTLAPHLEWRDAPLAELLAQATGLTVSVANDATLGARAERMFGAGRGIRDLVYLNGGASGIGGGIIAGGTVLGGVTGYAGEFGHTFSTEAGDALEDVVNRAALVHAVGLTLPTDAALEQALRASSDPAVAALVRHQARTLARGLAGTINILNPQRVLLGGFLGTLLELQADALHDAVRERALAPALVEVEIARAHLGDDLLMIGAAELVFDRIVDEPLAFAGA